MKTLSTNISQKLDELKEQVAELDNRLTAHEGTFATKEHLHRVEMELSSLRGQLDVVRTKMEENEKKNQREHENFLSQLNKITTQYATLEDQLKDLNSQLSTLNARLAEEKELQKLSYTKISALATAVSAGVALLTYIVVHMHP